MMTIAIDERCCTVERLYFAGIDAADRPKWLIMSPGKPIEVRHSESIGANVYHHVCLDGEEAPSYLIAQILGMSFDYTYRRSGVSMMDHITKMKSLNLKWRKDPLEFVFTIYDYGPDEKERYVLRMEDKDGHTLVEETGFDSLKEVNLSIYGYLLTLRTFTEIPVTSVKLRASKRLITDWKKGRLYMFYDYTAFEDEPDDIV